MKDYSYSTKARGPYSGIEKFRWVLVFSLMRLIFNLAPNGAEKLRIAMFCGSFTKDFDKRHGAE